jgi:hypothetical protein
VGELAHGRKALDDVDTASHFKFKKGERVIVKRGVAASGRLTTTAISSNMKLKAKTGRSSWPRRMSFGAAQAEEATGGRSKRSM